MPADHLLPVCLRGSLLTSLSLGFLLGKMGTVTPTLLSLPLVQSFLHHNRTRVAHGTDPGVRRGDRP